MITVVGKMPEFKGTKARRLANDSAVAGGVAINVFHDRHVAGRTYGGKGGGTKEDFIDDLDRALKNTTKPETRKDKAIGVLRIHLRKDAEMMENDVYDKTGEAFYDDLPDKKMKAQIQSQGKAGLNRIRSQDLDSLKS